MSATPLVIFDDGLGRFGPLTDMRACFELRSGAVTTQQRIERILGRRAGTLWVPESLTDLVAERQPHTQVNPRLPDDQHAILVNGRWLGTEAADAINDLTPGTALLDSRKQLVAAHLRPEQAAGLTGTLPVTGLSDLKFRYDGRPLLAERPWHLLDRLEAALAADLRHTGLDGLDPIPPHVARVGGEPILAGPDVRVQPMVTLDTTQGPIVLDAGTTVGSMSLLQGPCYIGPGSTVQPHTALRPNTVIGPMCKVAGEVSFSIIQGHTNKSHAGFLGHSLVGEWVNLGADTNVSNLKNTYGRVRMQLGAGEEPEDTGRVFMGPVIGDLVRTAIGTRLVTGACIGTAAMLAVSAMAPKHVPRLAYVTDQGQTLYDIDKLVATARTMLSRRHVDLTDAFAQRLAQLHAAQKRV